MPIPIFSVGNYPERYYPLALGMLQARARACEDLHSRVTFLPFLNLHEEAVSKIGKVLGPGIWLFSNYGWSHARAMRVSRAVKALDKRNLTLHGGPSIPRYAEAAARLFESEPHIDILVRGEAELVCEELLRHLVERFEEQSDWREGLEKIHGITWVDRDLSEPVRTPDRPRIENLDELPSPYLSGIFDSLPRLSAVLETNRGCPYTCAFCDWGSLVGQKIKKFSMDRVKAEIEWIARRETVNLFIADANFGIFERDLEIAEEIARMKQKHGYPRKLVPTFAKNSTTRLVELVRILRSSGLVVEANVALQTTDPATLETVKRQNIRTDRYLELMKMFRDLGIPFNTDLMVNLPGQTPEAFRTDLQKFLDLEVPVQIWPTIALPNSAMSAPAFQQENELELDEEGMVVACKSFSREQRDQMMRLRSIYLMGENLSYLRYVMRFLQWDHGIEAVKFLDDLQAALSGQPQDFPKFADSFVFQNATVAVAHIPESESFRVNSFSRLEDFYQAVKRFVCSRYGVPQDSAMDVAFQVNRAVLPDPTKSYPLTVELEHDFVSYIQDHRQGKGYSLTEYGPGEMKISDPEKRSQYPLTSAVQNTIREQTWELPSDIWSTPAVLT